MYCRAIACDFDGTTAINGQLAPEVAAALATARVQGYVTLLVSGRLLEDLRALTPDLSMFDAVVAENGAVIHLPYADRIIQLGVPPPNEFLGELRAHGVPFHVGNVVVGTWDRHTAAVLELVRRSGVDCQPIFNREALMLLPSGVNKAFGTCRALEELERSARNLIAFGDAENDLPLLSMAEVGVAARGAVPVLAAHADDHLTQAGGAGVAHYIHRLLEAHGTVPTPPRHQLVLGTTAEGTPAALPASGTNVMISGDPRSGKSWLTGLVAEQLLDRGYLLCILDPEGDHLSLGQRRHVLVLGADLALPDPSAVPRVLRSQGVSIVLNLAPLSVQAQTAYVNAVLHELESCCAQIGLPNWIVIDEAQYFFHETSALARRFAGTVNFLFATHRPSLVSDVVYAGVQAHVITRTAIDDERYFITSLLQARGTQDVVVADALMMIDMGHAGLLIEDAVTPRWQIFTPAGRVTSHTHHARKYADTRLPDDKAFRFLCTNGSQPIVAHTVVEFHLALKTVNIASLHHHMTRGDFSRWIREVLGNLRFAAEILKLERTTQAGATPNREELLAAVEEHYLLGGRGAESVDSQP